MSPTQSLEVDAQPSVNDVAALLLSRTTTSGGGEAGTFNNLTKPTDTQVTELIDQAINDTYPLIGTDIPDAPGSDIDAIRESVKAAITYRAAALVEITYYSEQVDRRTSPYTELQEQWEESIKRIQGAIESAGGQTPSGSDGGAMKAQFSFPADAGGMVGWGTNW